MNALVGTCGDASGAVAVLPDGARLVVGHADGRVRLVRLPGGETVWWGAEEHGPVLQSVACSPDGTLLASAAEDHCIRLWDAATGAVVSRLTGAATVFALRFSSDGEKLAAAGAEDTVKVHGIPSLEVLVECRGHEAWVETVDWSPAGDRLVSGANDATVRFWDAVTGKELERREMPVRPGAVAWSPSGGLVAVGLEDGEVVLLGVGGPVADVLRFRTGTGAVNSIAWHPSGTSFATAGDDAVTIWDPADGSSRARFPLDAAYAYRLSWAATGQYLAASVSGDGIRVWDVGAAPARR